MKNTLLMFTACLLANSRTALGIFLILSAPMIAAEESYYLSHHGVTPKYKPGEPLAYANPNAPKGGSIKLAAMGNFDSLNPYIIQGTAAIGLLTLGSFLFYESLMEEPRDDVLVNYGLIAESVDHAADNTYVIFTIRPNVTFHDKSPLTVDDVIFSFNLLMKSGNPFLKSYYRDAAAPEKIAPNKVKFPIKNPKNKELAMILGQFPILCKKFWEGRNFEQTILTPPISTGPYIISKVDAGRSITYKRNPDYWGKDLPHNKGRWNFEEITWDYYRDSTLTMQAFLAGDIDFRQELKPTEWFKNYGGPSFKSGFHVKAEIKHESPPGGYGLYFNLRRPQFQDPRVRHAISLFYDFEWVNKNIFQGKFSRIRSYFQNTELAASGLPTGEELDLLTPYKAQLPPQLFTTEFQPPKTDGSGNLRPQIRQALALLKEAGYITEEGKVLNAKTKEQLSLEILVTDPYHERVFMPFITNLMKLGIDAKMRVIDTAQYQSRMDNFDFDMTNPRPNLTFSPGNEQQDQWGSKQADMKGSKNVAGVKNPIVDHLISTIIDADDRASLVAASRALDRVLQWQYVSIPLYYNGYYWVAYKDRFARPAKMPTFDLPFVETWWIDPVKDKAFQLKYGNAVKGDT